MLRIRGLLRECAI